MVLWAVRYIHHPPNRCRLVEVHHRLPQPAQRIRARLPQQLLLLYLRLLLHLGALYLHMVLLIPHHRLALAPTPLGVPLVHPLATMWAVYLCACCC